MDFMCVDCMKDIMLVIMTKIPFTKFSIRPVPNP